MSELQAHAPLFGFAGGGTGGHLYPMLSVAHEILKRRGDARFVFFTTRRPIDERVIRQAFDETTARIVAQAIEPLPRSAGGAIRFIRAWRASMRQCRRVMREDRPGVVLGSGGYGSAPAIRAAGKLGVPTALLNPDAVPGKANRFLAVRSDAVIVQWPLTEQSFSRAARVLSLGCPVRAEFADASRGAGIQRFSLDPQKKTLLVTGASQGASTINNAMARVAGDIARHPTWQVLHLAGREGAGAVRQAYAAFDVPAKVLDYTEHMADALAAADLVITRAGASTLAEITAVGVASVLMPYPYHRDRHQHLNASMLTEAGAAVLVEDRVSPGENAEALGRVLTRLLPDDATLREMSRLAGSIGQPVACQNITDFLFALASGRGNRPELGDGLLRRGGDCRENRREDESGSSGDATVEAAA